MYLRLSLSCLILLICLSCTALARSNGPRPPAPRHHRRRAASLSEYLIPPPPPFQRNQPPRFPHNGPLRQGKIMNPVPSPAIESPGFFARFMNFINPWATNSPSSPSPHNTQHSHPGFQASAQQQSHYKTPPPAKFDTHGHQEARFTSPQASHTQLPQLSGQNCHPCDSLPWIPILQGSGHGRYAEGSPGISLDHHNQESQSPPNYHIPSPSHEVKLPDFGWEHPPPPPQILHQQSGSGPHNPDFPSPLTGPIPNPHLYPGAMPPLFKAGPWDSAPAATDHIEQFRNNAASGGGIEAHEEHSPLEISNNEFNPSTTFDPHIAPTGSGGDYVDVLPPGAETASGPEVVPPPQDHSKNELLDSGSQSTMQHAEHETVSGSLTKAVDTHQGATEHHKTTVNQPTDLGTKLSSDGQHVIHIQQSPVIDLSDDSESKDSNVSGVTEEPPVILQNADGTYGINMTWSNEQDSEAPQVSGDQTWSEEHRGDSSENITSLLLDILRNSGNNSEFGQRIVTTQKPYGTYEGVVSLDERQRLQSTTEEPLFDAIVRSYNNFQKGEEERENGKPWIDPKEIHPGVGFSVSSGTGLIVKDQGNQQHGAKRSKQVQIIIPYTSQYTPSPFQYGIGSWTDPGKIQSRKVPVAPSRDLSKESTEATEEEKFHILQRLENVPRTTKITRPILPSKTNTSIDPLRLQKNIDNWTIQEYSRGTTVSTAVPSSPHRLQQSKKIPDEYFTTTEPVATIREAEKAFGNILNGFSFNDLDHEGSASSRVEVPHFRVSSSEKIESSSPKPKSTSSSEDVSWEQLPVSISPVSNERVYIVTPQPASKLEAASAKETSQRQRDSRDQFESIERAYQVLPEAVNNLQVASTGPATVPLWNIMEHEEYAAPNATTTASPKTPILYAGHSKVAHTRQ